MYILLVAVITLCGDLVFGQYSPCLSANGSRRPCIPFSQCEQLLSLSKNPYRTDEDTKLLHKSFCGSRGNVAHVCCPESNTGQRVNSPPACNTPDGKIGECINLFSCPHLTNLLQPPVPQEAISFVQSSRCFGPEEQSVCCGPPPTIPRYTTPRTTTIPEYDTLDDLAEPADCPALMTAFPPARSTECCGISVGVGNKIFGNTTGIDEYPWAVVIEYSIVGTERIALSCGGALISGKYVLTAAHCLAGRILQSQIPKKVRLGEYDTSNEGKDCILTSGGGVDCTDGATTIRIEKTIPHPKYVYGVSKNHDIGLIRLRDTAPYTDFIRPVCLPAKDLTKPENTPPYFSMYAVGWGATEDGAYSTLKRDVNLPFVSREKCQPVYNSPGRSVSLWEGQLCAGGKEAMDACKGDSGGPLVYENQEKFELIGIVSFGVGCGAKGVPGIYTNVYEYLDWIKSVIVA